MKKYTSAFAHFYQDQKKDFPKLVFENWQKYAAAHHIRPKRHLDIACGTGQFCIMMAQNGIHTQGFDLSPDMIHQARNNAKNAQLDIPFSMGDMTHIFPNSPYDFITCHYDAINHLTDFNAWQAVFQNTYNALESKGYFLFDFNTFFIFRLIGVTEYDPNYQMTATHKDDHHLEIAFRFKTPDGKRKIQRIVESFYDINVIQDALKKTGFNIVQTFGIGLTPSRDLNQEDKIHILCQKP